LLPKEGLETYVNLHKAPKQAKQLISNKTGTTDNKNTCKANLLLKTTCDCL